MVLCCPKATANANTYNSTKSKLVGAAMRGLDFLRERRVRGDTHMRHIDRRRSVILAAASAVVLAGPARAETQADQPTIEALMKKIDALQSRLDKVEGRERAAKRCAD